jgi:hypothetical protein
MCVADVESDGGCATRIEHERRALQQLDKARDDDDALVACRALCSASE